MYQADRIKSWPKHHRVGRETESSSSGSFGQGRAACTCFALMVKALLPLRGCFSKQRRALKIACSRKKPSALNVRPVSSRPEQKSLREGHSKHCFTPGGPQGPSPALVSLFLPLWAQVLGLQAEGVLAFGLGMLLW